MKTLRVTKEDLISANSVDEREWHIFIIHNLIQPSSIMARKDLKDLTISKLYFLSSVGVSGRALSAAEAREELQCIHGLSS